MKAFLYICLILICGVFYGCKYASKVQSVTPDKFEELIADNQVQLVDVRTVAEYSESHIANTINLNLMDEQFLDKAKQLLSTDKAVAIYCKSGHRSKIAAKKLMNAGYTVYDLDLGIKGWEKAGKPIVSL